jgi:ubiquinone/menaquinone biosynthesis C-methylase UbiE
MHWLLANPLRRLLESPEALLQPHVAPGMTVLEPGCGFGYFTLPLARMVGPTGKVLCVDVEPKVVARLQRRVDRAGLSSRVAASVCSPTDLGLGARSGQVDLVTVIHMMHELEDLPGFLRQVTALLKPGGRMLVLEPKGHVAPARFAVELEACREAGFTALPLPAGLEGRPVALLERRSH